MQEESSHPEPAPRVIKCRKGFAALDLNEIWNYRELLFFLGWRDILIRYKQTYLGVGWAVLQPILSTVVFVLIFGKLSKFDSKGAPYALIVLAGMAPWQFFSNSLTECSNSLVASASIISKVYFPRLLIPVSAVLSGLADFFVAFTLLMGMALWDGVHFTWRLFFLPVFAVMALLAALSAGFWLASLNIRYRDIKYVVPFLTRFGIYVSPVGFLTDIIPQHWRFLFYLNPMAGCIDGFRWALLGPRFEPIWGYLAVSYAIVIPIGVAGLVYFRSTERTFADII